MDLSGDLGASIWALVQLRVTELASPPERVVLIDLDNVGVPSPRDAQQHLQALLDAAGDYQLAVAAGRNESYEAFAQACVGLDIVAGEVPPERDAADLALLEVAGKLGCHGVREFVVASGDHALAAVQGQIHVIVPRGRAVSDRLTAAAVAIMHVDVARSSPNRRANATRNARRRRAAQRRAAS